MGKETCLNYFHKPFHHNLFEGRTVLVIAHRLQTVKEADVILVLEGGQIVEEGNYTELVRKKGIYAKMLELQSGF